MYQEPNKSRNSRDDQSSSPKYAAKIPESICTPDVVEASRLGRLEFFDGMPSDETVRKVYDQLDFARGLETFLTAPPSSPCQSGPGRGRAEKQFPISSYE